MQRKQILLVLVTVWSLVAGVFYYFYAYGLTDTTINFDQLRSTSINFDQLRDNNRDLPALRHIVMETLNKTSTAIGSDSKRNADKFFIYRCDDYEMKHCGGLNDRMRGMMNAYVFANLTGRTFKIEFLTPSPCRLEDYIVPNQVNWSLPRSIHQRVNENVTDVAQVSYVDNMKFYDSVDSLEFDMLPYMKSKYIYFKSNLDHLPALQKNPFYRKQLSWMQGMTVNEMNANIYKRLFQITPRVQHKVDEFFAKSLPNATHKLACAHLRTGNKLPNDPKIRIASLGEVWNFIVHIARADQSARVFIMSDSEQVVEEARRLEFKDRLLTTEGHVWHVANSVDIPSEEKCKGMEKVIMEQRILLHCDILMVAQSGISRMAAYLRGTDQGLYCILNDGKVVKCNRKDIKTWYNTKAK